MSEYPYWARASDVRTFALGTGCPAQQAITRLYEVPDTTWFVLGTVLHEGYELTCNGEIYERQQLIDYCMEMVHQQKTPDMIESASSRAKRTKATMVEDAERLAGKWWDAVHPDSKTRNPFFNQYQWPPKTEHMIEVEWGGQCTSDGGGCHLRSSHCRCTVRSRGCHRGLEDGLNRQVPPITAPHLRIRRTKGRMVPAGSAVDRCVLPLRGTEATGCVTVHR